jgi:hypothetical protein
MSRRSHHRGHRHSRSVRAEPASGPARAANLPADPYRPASAPAASAAPGGAPVHGAAASVEPHAVPAASPSVESPVDRPQVPAAPQRVEAPPGAGDVAGHAAPVNGATYADNGGPGSGCTAAQLRRFIKSRAWVPMHELRRRFGINGLEDDVTPVSVDGTTIFVGLPSREGLLLGELLRGGDIGYELSLDPRTPIVIGVYPMRPVPRH